mgnify:FL=1|tara:strand:- start:1478 stop:1879 length:402 start_codon:yes stop_codon:yes gene_type:complete
MEKTIEIAKCTLADMFEIRKESFDVNNRKAPVIEAKRFLIYFLVNELGIKFLHIPNHIKSIKSHATAMHHFYKMIDLMDMKHESNTTLKYMKFKNMMVEKGMDKLERELIKQIDLKKVVTWNIKQLKNMINEA